MPPNSKGNTQRLTMLHHYSLGVLMTKYVTKFSWSHWKVKHAVASHRSNTLMSTYVTRLQRSHSKVWYTVSLFTVSSKLSRSFPRSNIIWHHSHSTLSKDGTRHSRSGFQVKYALPSLTSQYSCGKMSPNYVGHTQRSTTLW